MQGDTAADRGAGASTRAVDALADEIRRMLDEGVVAEAQDIDLCMILGAGWPFWLGGITPYLDRSGASERVTGGRFLPRGVASLPASRADGRSASAASDASVASDRPAIVSTMLREMSWAVSPHSASTSARLPWSRNRSGTPKFADGHVDAGVAQRWLTRGADAAHADAVLDDHDEPAAPRRAPTSDSPAPASPSAGRRR